MKLKKRKAILASTMILSLNLSASDFYVVKKGDSLLRIIYAKNLKPIYGKHGALAQVLKLNPELRASAGNKIFPNMKICLVNTKLADTVPTANSQQPTANSQQPTANSQQPTEYSTHQPRDSLRRGFR